MKCTEFLEHLSDYFDEKSATQVRAELERHMKACSHCNVVFNTTRQTIEVYRNNELYELPLCPCDRLRKAIMKKCSELIRCKSKPTPPKKST